jgi:hypothetical protein
VAVKVTQVKAVHKEVVSPKEKVEKKIKETIVKKEKKEIKKTVKNTCDKVAKIVCKSATGEEYVNCHKSTVTAVKTFLKKVEKKTKQAVQSCEHKSCVKETVKYQSHAKKTSEIVSLCFGEAKCEKKVQQHCTEAVKKVQKTTGKIHVVKVTKVDKNLQKKVVKQQKKEIKKTITKTCDKVTKYVCA